jgi:sulfofructose kinase
MDVLCVGHAAWDISVYLDSFPAENSKCETESLLECGGGPAANAACTLARWGAACALAARLGKDAYADRVIDGLVTAGVDVSLVHRDSNVPTPVSVILVNSTTASRTIVNRKVSGTRSLDSTDSVFEPASWPAWPEPPAVLLFDGHELEASLAAMRLFPDARTVLDAGSARPGSVELARHVDHLVASERFARQLGGLSDLNIEARQRQAVRALFGLNGHPVVITLGERGLVWGTTEFFEHMPVFPVNSVDTTAAGDIFHGAFAYGVWKRLPMNHTLRLASAAAALTTTIRGGQTSIPSFEQVQAFLNARQ